MGEAALAAVSGFRLDKYDVTVGRFRQFVNAWDGGSGLDGGAGYEPPAGSGKHAHLNGGLGLAEGPNVDAGQVYEQGWDATDWNGLISPTDGNLTSCPPYSTWTNPAATNENRPINCVTWQEAYAFCIWDGGFLPSESEWEYAAAGGSQQLAYPWGDMPEAGTNNQYAIYDCCYPAGAAGCYPNGNCADARNIAPVGTATQGLGVWHQLDLVGNVWEWTLDYWDGASPYVDPCTDCAYLTAGVSDRVMRGGRFLDVVLSGLLPVRHSNDPTTRIYTLGFRCARTP